MFGPVIAIPARRQPARRWAMPGASLHLDFRTGRAFGAALGDLVCTRATGGTAPNAAGNVVAFGVNALRRTDRGLLIESAATNSQRQSVINATGWEAGFGGGATAPTMTFNGFPAPDGSNDATRMVLPAVGAAGAFSILAARSTNTTALTAASWTFSVWLRGHVGGEIVYLHGTPNGSTYITSPAIVLTTSWVRYQVTGMATAANWYLQIGVDRRDAAQAAQAAATFFAWGAQLETGSVATSYIPTTTAGASRAFDNVWLPLGSWWNASEGTLIATSVLNGTAIDRSIAITNNAGGNPDRGIGIKWVTTTRASATDWSTDTGALVGAAPAGLRGRIVGSFRASPANRSTAFNGVAQLDAATVYSAPNTSNRLQFGAHNAAALQPLNGWIEELIFVPRYATAAEIAAWSTLA